MGTSTLKKMGYQNVFNLGSYGRAEKILGVQATNRPGAVAEVIGGRDLTGRPELGQRQETQELRHRRAGTLTLELLQVQRPLKDSDP